MSSTQTQIVFIPVNFCCQQGSERVCRMQYVAVPVGVTVGELRAAARRVLQEIASGLRLDYAFQSLRGAGGPLVCGFEILPITAIPR